MDSKEAKKILGLSEKPTISEIKTAYRKLSIKFHPDQNNGDDFFTLHYLKIQQAYNVLIATTSKNANEDSQKKDDHFEESNSPKSQVDKKDTRTANKKNNRKKRKANSSNSFLTAFFLIVPIIIIATTYLYYKNIPSKPEKMESPAKSSKVIEQETVKKPITFDHFPSSKEIFRQLIGTRNITDNGIIYQAAKSLIYFILDDSIQMELNFSNYGFYTFSGSKIREFRSIDEFSTEDCHACSGIAAIFRLREKSNGYWFIEEFDLDYIPLSSDWASTNGLKVKMTSNLIISEAIDGAGNNGIFHSHLDIINLLNFKEANSFYYGETDDGSYSDGRETNITSTHQYYSIDNKSYIRIISEGIKENQDFRSDDSYPLFD